MFVQKKIFMIIILEVRKPIFSTINTSRQHIINPRVLVVMISLVSQRKNQLIIGITSTNESAKLPQIERNLHESLVRGLH